jgi:hypothetical protein
MGQPTLCTVPLPVDVSLESRVLSSGRFFPAWLPSLSLEKSLPYGHVCCLVQPPHVGGRGARFIPPLSKGKESPEAVYLALVEKVPVLRDR